MKVGRTKVKSNGTVRARAGGPASPSQISGVTPHAKLEKRVTLELGRGLKYTNVQCQAVSLSLLDVNSRVA